MSFTNLSPELPPRCAARTGARYWGWHGDPSRIRLRAADARRTSGPLVTSSLVPT
jgi:hypothetical protein